MPFASGSRRRRCIGTRDGCSGSAVFDTRRRKISGSAKISSWFLENRFKPFANRRDARKLRLRLQRVCRLRFSARTSVVVVSRVW